MTKSYPQVIHIPMVDNKFNFCPECGGKNIAYLNNKKWFCSDCGFDLYNNVASAVGAIISDSEGNVLFEVRAKNPRKGFLALPGGFTDQDETAEQAVVRECMEEIGVQPESVKYLCSFPNDYMYKNVAYKTCDMFFEASIPAGAGSIPELIEKLHGQESEVSGFKCCNVKSSEDVKSLPLAFESAKKALTVWLSKD